MLFFFSFLREPISRKKKKKLALVYRMGFCLDAVRSISTINNNYICFYFIFLGLEESALRFVFLLSLNTSCVANRRFFRKQTTTFLYIFF